MIKTGIHDLAQLSGRRRLQTLLGRDRLISLTLYEQLAELPDGDQLAERTLAVFRDEHGVYKRTYARRFEEFDEQLLQFLQERFEPTEAVTLLDLAVSDGRTACDLFERLGPHFPRLSYHASDLGSRMLVLAEGRLQVVLGTSGVVNELVWPPFVFRPLRPESRLFYPINHLVRALVERLLADPLRERFRRGQVQATPLQLFSPRVRALARTDARFHLGEQDVLQPLSLAGATHVVRAMNLLNPTYFGPAELDRGLANIHRALRPDGWLVTGSNQHPGSVVDGGIYRRSATGFKRVWRSGNGPHVEEQILQFAARAAQSPSPGRSPGARATPARPS